MFPVTAKGLTYFELLVFLCSVPGCCAPLWSCCITPLWFPLRPNLTPLVSEAVPCPSLASNHAHTAASSLAKPHYPRPDPGMRFSRTSVNSRAISNSTNEPRSCFLNQNWHSPRQLTYSRPYSNSSWQLFWYIWSNILTHLYLEVGFNSSFKIMVSNLPPPHTLFSVISFNEHAALYILDRPNSFQFSGGRWKEISH